MTAKKKKRYVFPLICCGMDWLSRGKVVVSKKGGLSDQGLTLCTAGACICFAFFCWFVWVGFWSGLLFSAALEVYFPPACVRTAKVPPQSSLFIQSLLWSFWNVVSSLVFLLRQRALAAGCKTSMLLYL